MAKDCQFRGDRPNRPTHSSSCSYSYNHTVTLQFRSFQVGSTAYGEKKTEISKNFLTRRTNGMVSAPFVRMHHRESASFLLAFLML